MWQGTRPYDNIAFPILSSNGRTLQEVVLDMPTVEAVAKTFGTYLCCQPPPAFARSHPPSTSATEHLANLRQTIGEAPSPTVTRIHGTYLRSKPVPAFARLQTPLTSPPERPSTDLPSRDQDPPPTVIDLEILKEFRIIVSVRGDIPAATEANVAKILDFFEKVVTYNANIILELRYGPGLIPSEEAANDIRLKTQSGPGFTALYDALKAARPGDGDSSTSGQPRAKDVTRKHGTKQVCLKSNPPFPPQPVAARIQCLPGPQVDVRLAPVGFRWIVSSFLYLSDREIPIVLYPLCISSPRRDSCIASARPVVCGCYLTRSSIFPVSDSL